ncbi:MAG TPA: hypothetical protein VHO84_04885, partial [Syntrophorhabdaceae bacterium]|nr:hypothetical protein [Syntrophorhabdaceae bacterium]
MHPSHRPLRQEIDLHGRELAAHCSDSRAPANRHNSREKQTLPDSMIQNDNVHARQKIFSRDYVLAFLALLTFLIVN